MANYNRVILAGNLTRDPELSYTANNLAVCKFGLAINRKWKDRDGNMKEDTCFVDITAFGRTGEVINQYMSKGRGILVEGRLNFRQWTDPEGKNRSKLSVVAENFQFLGDRGGGGGGGGGGGASAPRGAAADDGGGRSPAPVHDEPPVEDEPPHSDADIPF